jgi:acylphosphatase
MDLARHYRICGRVQGVGFRYFTRRAALRLGVRGWVRNTPEGDVEVHAEASAIVLQHFRAELERGPSNSEVLEVIEQPVETAQCSSFDIRS